MSLSRENRRYTYADYLTWDESERIELIDGVPYHTYGGEITEGAPVMVVEILSPSTGRKDRMIKFQKYQQVGVREYWIIDPDTKTVQVCILEGGRYFTTVHADTDTAPVIALPGCSISLPDVFAE